MSEEQATKIYIDVCCLNRSLDDQTQARIRHETEALDDIFLRIDVGEWQWLSSEAVEFEIERNPNPVRRGRVRLLLVRASGTIGLTPQVRERAIQLTEMGFKPLDALHLASAESATVDVLLTTDDRFLSVARRAGRAISVHVANPRTWIDEGQGDATR